VLVELQVNVLVEIPASAQHPHLRLLDTSHLQMEHHLYLIQSLLQVAVKVVSTTVVLAAMVDQVAEAQQQAAQVELQLSLELTTTEIVAGLHLELELAAVEQVRRD
jgi:hypothetical protein